MSTESLTLDDYLSLARNCLFVANEAIVNSAAKDPTPEVRKRLRDLFFMIGELDQLRCSFQSKELIPIVGVVGLAPNPALKKFAETIINSRDLNGWVTIGSCAFKTAKEMS